MCCSHTRDGNRSCGSCVALTGILAAEAATAWLATIGGIAARSLTAGVCCSHRRLQWRHCDVVVLAAALAVTGGLVEELLQELCRSHRIHVQRQELWQQIAGAATMICGSCASVTGDTTETSKANVLQLQRMQQQCLLLLYCTT